MLEQEQLERVIIRSETENDIEAIFTVNAQAFPTDAEARLVNQLRNSTTCISLVAEYQGKIVGHILFTPMTIVGSEELSLLGLAPMAVLPEMQRSGIGSLLVERGLTECKTSGCDAVAVLGHPEFYPKFGFKPSVRFNITSEYDVPDEVFMLQESVKGSLQNASGVMQYHPTFSTL